MNTKEIQEILKRVATNWNILQLPAQRKEAFPTWERYLGDLDPRDVSREIDARALAGGFPPRPGDVRIAVLDLDGNAPSPEQAWVIASRVRTAIEAGVEPEFMAPLVAETIKSMGRVWTREIFLKVYAERRQKYLVKEFGINEG